MDDDRLTEERLALKLLASIELDSQQQVDHHAKVLELIKTLVLNKKTVCEFGHLFKMNAFSQLLKLLRKDDHKFEACKWILETMKANFIYNNRNEIIIIEDEVLISHLLKLFVTLNDSLNLLTSADDIEHLTSIIIYFIERITIQDKSIYLDFLVQCRGSLNNLNPILEYLADRSLALALVSQDIHKKRTLRQNFLNSCLAFTLTTIPAIDKPSKRIDLYLKACQIASEQMSLSLADCYLKQVLADLKNQLDSIDPEDNDSTLLNLRKGAYARTDATSQGKLVLLDQVRTLVKMMVKFEDHIDLKHKIIFKNLVKCSFSGHPSLIEQIRVINTIDDYDAEVNSITTS